MLFIEYEIYKRKYLDAQRLYNEILEEQEELFSQTQPNAIRYDLDKVQSSGDANILENYVIAKEQRRIEERLKEAKEMLEARADFLKYAEKDLRASKHIVDIVYCCRYLDNMKVKKIMRVTNYSKAQIFRILNRIKTDLEGLTDE